MFFKMQAVFLLCFLLLAPISEGMVAKRSDNVDVNALQNTVHHQSSQMTKMAADIAALKNEVGVLKDKVANLSTPVAFTALFSNQKRLNSDGPNASQPVLFDDAFTNIGNAYDPNTGKFTAPVTGVYIFTLKMMASRQSSATDLALSVRTKDRIIAQAWLSTTKADMGQGMTQAATRLAAGDMVYVRAEYGQTCVGGSWWTLFTGFLLQPL